MAIDALGGMAAAGGAGFALLALAVARGWSDAADRRLLAWLAPARAAALRPGRLHTSLTDVAALGGDTLRLIALAAILAALLPLGRAGDAARFAGVVIGGRLALALAKAGARRARPAGDHAVSTHTTSFPSGHAFNGAVFLLAAVLLFGRGAPPASVAIELTLAVLLSVALGVARLLLGVHWPSDILAGWLGAVGWVGATLSLARA